MQSMPGRVMESVAGRAHGEVEAHDRVAVNPGDPSHDAGQGELTRAALQLAQQVETSSLGGGVAGGLAAEDSRPAHGVTAALLGDPRIGRPGAQRVLQYLLLAAFIAV